MILIFCQQNFGIRNIKLLDFGQNIKTENVFNTVLNDLQGSRFFDDYFEKSFQCGEKEHAAKIGAGTHFHEYHCPARAIPSALTYFLTYVLTQLVFGNSDDVERGKEAVDLYLQGNCPLGVRESTLFLVVK